MRSSPAQTWRPDQGPFSLMEADNPLTMLIRGRLSHPKEYRKARRPCMNHHALSTWKRLRQDTSSWQRFFQSFVVEDATAPGEKSVRATAAKIPVRISS